MRKAARHMPDHLHSMIAPSKVCTRRNCPHQRQQGTWEAWRETLRPSDHGQHHKRNQQARQVRFRQMLEGKKEIAQESMAPFFEPQHAVQFTEGDLYSNAGEETHQNGA